MSQNFILFLLKILLRLPKHGTVLLSVICSKMSSQEYVKRAIYQTKNGYYQQKVYYKKSYTDAVGVNLS